MFMAGTNGRVNIHIHSIEKHEHPFTAPTFRLVHCDRHPSPQIVLLINVPFKYSRDYHLGISSTGPELVDMCNRSGRRR
jgi:hypothetical protein